MIWQINLNMLYADHGINTVYTFQEILLNEIKENAFPTKEKCLTLQTEQQDSTKINLIYKPVPPWTGFWMYFYIELLCYKESLFIYTCYIIL